MSLGYSVTVDQTLQDCLSVDCTLTVHFCSQVLWCTVKVCTDCLLDESERPLSARAFTIIMVKHFIIVFGWPDTIPRHCLALSNFLNSMIVLIGPGTGSAVLSLERQIVYRNWSGRLQKSNILRSINTTFAETCKERFNLWINPSKVGI